ncbi:MAG TPA: NAD(P)-binding domain-containing protein [Gammaproteobacteria bacterium]|nr:NAD(P)-binding domain-containing protein [Gammaproteobacteria bacterium]
MRQRPTLTRRTLLSTVGLALGGAALLDARFAAAQEPLKIGIIGTGRIGGALARHWVKAGHEVFMSSRHPEELEALAKELGPKAHVGQPREAAAFGSVVLVSVPYGSMPQIGTDFAAELAGKVIIDTSNPVANRDGPQVAEWQRKGAGVSTAELLKNNRVVRAFNCIPAASLADRSNRQPERIAIPIGGDDAAAIAIAERLIRDAGFDPVMIGTLAQSRQFDLGQPLAQGNLSAAELRERMPR